MSHQQKMAEAIRRAYDRGEISQEIMRQLPSVEELAIGIVVVGGVLVGLGVAAGAVASTGVGAVLEAIAAGIVLALAASGIISSAKQVIAGMKVLVKFYTATKLASSYRELDAAGRDFAEGIAEVGVGTVMMILSVLGARQGLKMGKGALGKTQAAAGAGSAGTARVQAPQEQIPKPPEPTYEGKLRGETVKLKGVETKHIEYTKRSPADRNALRAAFDRKVRSAFLKDISTNPQKVAELRQAGLTDADIADMQGGNPPESGDWQVHHKLPLDDNGTNDFSNLILMKDDPYHRSITNAQQVLTKGMTPGMTKTMDFPIPAGDGVVYPPEAE